MSEISRMRGRSGRKRDSQGEKTTLVISLNVNVALVPVLISVCSNSIDVIEAGRLRVDDAMEKVESRGRGDREATDEASVLPEGRPRVRKVGEGGGWLSENEDSVAMVRIDVMDSER